MNKLSCIIIDDQKKAREMIGMHLEANCPHVDIRGMFPEPQSGAEFLNKNRIDIVFLDVEMGEFTGFDIFENIDRSGHIPLFIFVTGHSDYAVDAIKLDAFDFILKPVSPDEIVRVIEKAEAKTKEILFQQRIQQTFFDNDKKNDQLQVLVSGGVDFIKTNDIIYLKASRNYTEIYLKGGRQIMASKPLLYFEEQLKSTRFVRSHRSYIVNLKEVRAFRTADGGYLELTENHRASITAGNKEILMNRMADM